MKIKAETVQIGSTMFANSTQRKFWMFESQGYIQTLRTDSNRKACKGLLKSTKVSSQDDLLSYQEELHLLRSYLVNLKEFCRKFTPPMRRSVIGTAFIYMKRFYINESCMEHHPRNIGITCAYLACKVDEFNVSIDQFLKNVKGDCKKAQKTVLTNELLLMKKLKFHLTVHLPYRAVEGFLIDLRARFPPARDKTELMTQEIEDYLDKAMFTDACFLFTPSQIALSSVNNAAEKIGLDLTDYLRGLLFESEPDAYEYFCLVSVEIKKLIDQDLQSLPHKDSIKKIEKKLNEIMT